jgi:DNA-directed RNA polymerase subunit RPC12/RpoP
MSIRFTCLACKTVLKIAEMISEQRKVRCTGCGVVILLTPDPDAEDGMTVSIPQQLPKPKQDPGQPVNPWLAAGIIAAALIVIGGGLWWYFHVPVDRGAIEGQVSLDNAPLRRGQIRFVPLDGNPKAYTVSIAIVEGRYSASASTGPFLGKNRWEITGNENERVAERFNVKSNKEIAIKSGDNQHDFDVASK